MIPSEIGVVRMSIQDGVVSRYNQMIGPGTLPVGYKSDAKVGRGALIFAVISSTIEKKNSKLTEKSKIDSKISRFFCQWY